MLVTKMFAPLAILLASTSVAYCYITLDYSCTKYTANYVYNTSATSCSNYALDVACESYFPKGENVAMYPTPGRNDARPLRCYSSDYGVTMNYGLKNVAVKLCPKTCGFCCEVGIYTTPTPVRHD